MSGRTRACAAVAFIAMVLCIGCPIPHEWLNMEPVTVDATIEVDSDTISVFFSAAMDRARTEDATEIRREGSTLAIDRTWSSDTRTLLITPAGGIEPNDVITVSVDTSAEDSYGNSLSERFERTFDLRTENDRPVVLSVTPDDQNTTTDLTTDIVITVSEPLDTETVIGGISISPDPGYVLLFEANDTVFRFRPSSTLESDTRYTVTVDTSVRDTAGNAFAERWESSFRTAQEVEQEVTSVELIRTGELLQDDTVVFINNTTGLTVEKDDSFRVQLATAIDTSERSSAVTVSPSANAEFAWNATLDTVVVSFGEPLVWDTEYTLSAADKRFRFIVDGASSQPPSVARVMFIEDISTPTFSTTTFGGSLTFSQVPAVQSAFDIYVDLSSGANLIFGSVLSAFSLSANNSAVAIELNRIEIAPTAPAPNPAPGPDERVVRVVGTFTKDAGSNGVVTLELSTDLADDMENSLAELYRLIINAN